MAARPDQAVPKTSCISHRPGVFYTKIYADYMAITGSVTGAFLLYFLEWATTVGHADEENWITVSLSDLATRSNGIASKETCRREMEKLIALQVVEKFTPDEPVPSSYRLNLRRLQGECDSFASPMWPTTPPRLVAAQNEPVEHGSAQNEPGVGSKCAAKPDSVLIDVFNNKDNDGDSPPTPLPEQNNPDMEQRIDHWAQSEARTHGVTLKINTGKKREALTEADCPELREQIAALIRTGSGDVTQDVLRLVGFGGRARASGGMARQSFGVKLTRGQSTIQNQPKVDTALQESPLGREIVACRNEAGIQARSGDSINMPQWKVAVLDAMRLGDKAGFHERLTTRFSEFENDYREGVNTDAIVESFFESEQRHTRSERNSKTGDIREIIASLSA